MDNKINSPVKKEELDIAVRRYRNNHTVVSKGFKAGMIALCSLLGAGVIAMGTLYGVTIVSEKVIMPEIKVSEISAEITSKRIVNNNLEITLATKDSKKEIDSVVVSFGDTILDTGDYKFDKANSKITIKKDILLKFKDKKLSINPNIRVIRPKYDFELSIDASSASDESYKTGKLIIKNQQAYTFKIPMNSSYELEYFGLGASEPQAVITSNYKVFVISNDEEIVEVGSSFDTSGSLPRIKFDKPIFAKEVYINVVVDTIHTEENHSTYAFGLPALSDIDHTNMVMRYHDDMPDYKYCYHGDGQKMGIHKGDRVIGGSVYIREGYEINRIRLGVWGEGGYTDYRWKEVSLISYDGGGETTAHYTGSKDVIAVLDTPLKAGRYKVEVTSNETIESDYQWLHPILYLE